METALVRKSIRRSALVTYSRSGGPGGQNVNKVNTKVTARLDLAGIEGLGEKEERRLRTALAGRLSGEGQYLVVQADRERSQTFNEEAAFRRLETQVISAARLPKPRRPTKPTKASRERRLEVKRRLGAKKAARQTKPDASER